MKYGLSTQIYWRYVILDEGHKVKNETSNISIQMSKVRSQGRIILTGTPLQNNLHELWALLRYLEPDIFVESTVFDEAFDLKENYFDVVILRKAALLLDIFQIRRMKGEVEKLLPPKHVMQLSVGMTNIQKYWAKKLLLSQAKMLKQIEAEVVAGDAAKMDQQHTKDIKDIKDTKKKDQDQKKNKNEKEDEKANGNKEKHDHQNNLILSEEDKEEKEQTTNAWKRLNSLLMQLRKICNHPYLIPGADPSMKSDGSTINTNETIITASKKMMLLDRILPKLLLNQSRVVMFSQFTSMLDILEDYLNYRGYEYVRLDGSTSRVRRTLDLRVFNRKKSTIFIYLMSTRAGGLGLNCQTADTVILYDSDWNPQVDQQAMARVHRIGQKKKVHIYTLSTSAVHVKLVSFVYQSEHLQFRFVVTTTNTIFFGILLLLLLLLTYF